MRIEIRGRGLTTSDGLRARLERRLAFALGRFAPRIGRVRVRLEDVNGPRGGVDKRCRLEVAIHPDLTVVVEEPDPDLYAAIDRAADQTGQALGRAAEETGSALGRAMRWTGQQMQGAGDWTARQGERMTGQGTPPAEPAAPRQ